jgi:hypothetical protein
MNEKKVLERSEIKKGLDTDIENERMKAKVKRRGEYPTMTN